MRPGRASRERRAVLATTSSWRVPSPMVAIQRSRLCARVAATSQAALAANLPEAVPQANAAKLGGVKGLREGGLR